MKKRTVKSDFYYSSATIVTATVSGLAQVAAIWHFVGVNSDSDPFFMALVAFQTINALATAARGPIVNRLTPVTEDDQWMRAGRRIALASTAVVAVIVAAALGGGILLSALDSGNSVASVATEPFPVHLYMVLTAAVLTTASSCVTGQLISRFHFRETALAYIASAGVTVSLTFFLCAAIGAYGASASVLASNVVLIVLLTAVLRREGASYAAPTGSAVTEVPTTLGANRLGRYFYEVSALAAVSGSWQVCILTIGGWATRNLEGGSASVFNIGASAIGIATGATSGALTYVLMPHAVEAVQRGALATRLTIIVDSIRHPLILLVPIPVCVLLTAGGFAEAFTFASTQSLTETYLLMFGVLGVGALVQTVATSSSLIALTDHRWAILLITGFVTVVANVAFLKLVDPANILGGAVVYLTAMTVATALLFAVATGRGALRVLLPVGSRLAFLTGLALVPGLAGRFALHAAAGNVALAVAIAAGMVAAYFAILLATLPEYRGLMRGRGLGTAGG